MGETQHQQHLATTSSKFALKGGGVGEIVEVQGGHIVRSTGRKDRHSKVCTAKGPRDRRVRLSAHTAIQFYDVQDRLGYDRPSKAVDWLIKKAKPAIDELAELPAWDPHATIANSIQQQHHYQQQQQMNQENNNNNDNTVGVSHHMMDLDTTGSAERRVATAQLVGNDVGMRNLQEETPNHNSSSFLPPSLESDSFVDTIKSFFPMGATAETPPSSIQFQAYPQDLLSRTSSQSQDLRLSLQSFQDPVLLHHHHHHHQQQQQAQHQTQQQNQSGHLFFSVTNQLGLDGSSTGWSEQPHPELGRFQRSVAWNSSTAYTGTSGGHGGTTGGGGGGGGFQFNSSPPTQIQLQQPLQPFFGQSQFLSQRGPLQSSNTPLIRAWIDPSMTATVTDHHHQHNHHDHLPQSIHQSSFSGLGFTSGGFSGFRVPARIQGEEEHDGMSDKPSSGSSDSRNLVS